MFSHTLMGAVRKAPLSYTAPLINQVGHCLCERIRFNRESVTPSAKIDIYLVDKSRHPFGKWDPTSDSLALLAADQRP